MKLGREIGGGRGAMVREFTSDGIDKWRLGLVAEKGGV